ncbi:hypothetical protein MNV49_002027 [Pseudohyphozyma bogoriensis]|nr:hypothetical protein MNV49_002027 [Pseudohyphozyma bogoriensis]
MAAPTAPAPVPTSSSPAPRVIPGFNQPAPEKKQRSRTKKTKSSANVPGDVAAAVEADGVATTETAPTGLSPALVAPVEELEEAEEKKTSAVEACAKRIRATNKKIQRIVAYEEKTEALNADQQKAIASKPTLEAIVKELQELLALLKVEESEDEARVARLKRAEEKRQAKEVEVAVAAAKSESESEAVLLFQFIHLYGLFSSPSGIVAPALPAVIANATANEVATVRMLHDAFTNGPLLGGHGDALEKLKKIASGSDEEALNGVTYGRVKELIAGLTAPPASSAPTPLPVTDSSLPAGPSDSVTALVDGAAEPPAPSFLQASELIPEAEDPAAPSTTEEKVSSWADDVATEAPAPPVEAAPAPAAGLDWAEDNSGDLPALPELAGQSSGAPATVVPVEAAPVEADGFQQARQPRRGGGPGGGGFRGNSNGPSPAASPAPATPTGGAPAGTW